MDFALNDVQQAVRETFHTFALIGGVMALVITLGGLMVGMNTMYTAVTGRVREIGMLQVLGFSKRAILVSVLLESLWIALLGGLLGDDVDDFVQSLFETGIGFDH